MDINKEHAKQLRRIADEIDPPVNHAGKAPQPETSEAAQEAHQAALTSFQTKKRGNMAVSLNAGPKKQRGG